MQRYKYVAVLGIDGMGSFNRCTPTPRMDEIYAHGAFTYSAQSMNPTISAQNWGGMLLGSLPEAHGLTNGIVSTCEYKNDALPSVFKLIRQAYPDAYLAGVCNWDPINFGIIENGIGVDKRTAGNDDEICDEIIDCVKNKPVFLFVQFDDVDGAGHSGVYGKEKHLAQITHTDELIGRVYDAYKENGLIDDTLFITIADHGGNRNGHGGMTPGERNIWLGVAGRGVRAGEIGTAYTKDISAIVLYALGIGLPAYDINGYSSQVPAGIWDGVGNDYLASGSTGSYPENKPTPALDGEGGLYSFFSPDSVRLAMFFDNDLGDAAGKCRVTEYGHVKFYNVGVRSSRAEFGKTGFIKVTGMEKLRRFTLAFWVAVDLDIPDEAVIVTDIADCTPAVKSPGWKIVNKSGATVAWFEAPDHSDGFLASFRSIVDGYVHCVISFDFDKNVCRQWINFGDETFYSDDPGRALPVFDTSCFTVGDDAGGIRNASENMLVNLDDLFVFDYAFDETDVEKLRRYYS